MLDLCVADQIFSCCNQTCLVKGCQGKTDALRPRLPLPSAVQAPLCCRLRHLCGSPELEGIHKDVLHLQTGFSQAAGTFPQLLVPITGEGGVAQSCPGGLGTLQVRVTLRGRTERNPTFALHLYRYCCLSIW